MHLDALGTHAHGVGNSHLDGTAVSDFAFYLASDALAHDVGVEVRLLHLEDVDLNILVGDLLQFLLEFVNFLTALTDDKARTRGADGDGDEFRGTLNDDAGNALLCQASEEVLTDVAILKDIVTEVLSSEPVGIPAANDTQTVAYRIYFLSHFNQSLVLVPTKIVTWFERLRIL